MAGTNIERIALERQASQSEARQYPVQGAAGPLLVKEMGEGPPVVVLHGGPGAHHDYLLPGFDRLADEFRLYLYDQRGGGRSRVRRPGRIGWRDHVADLGLLCKHWELQRAVLLGYSWGGLLALLYATEHPGNVRAMVLVDPAAGWGGYHERFEQEFARRSQSEVVKRMRAELEASGLAERDADAYRRRRFELAVAGYFRDPRDARDLTPFQIQTRAQEATWASLAGYGPELRRRLEALRVPTLILHGRHDPMPLEWAEELAHVMPAARLAVLEHSGHVPWAEEPERTFDEIRRFLREHLSP